MSTQFEATRAAGFRAEIARAGGGNELITLNDLTRFCGHFGTGALWFNGSVPNNGYVCRHPKNTQIENGYALCDEHACPIAYQACMKDLRELDADLFAQYSPEVQDDATPEGGETWMVWERANMARGVAWASNPTTEVQIENLKEFVRAIVRTRCWGWDGEEDVGTIQDLAEKYGIITPFVITQEQEDNNEIEDGAAGDATYTFSDWMQKSGVLAK
jgi:hypothetical protein